MRLGGLGLLPRVTGYGDPSGKLSGAVASPLLTDLIEYWKLDEVSGARAGSHASKNLTDTNTVTSQAGKISLAAEFTRANSERLARTDTDLRQNGNITVQAWIYAASLVGANASYGAGIVAHMTGDTAGDYWLGISSDGKVHFAHWESAGADADGRRRTALGAVTTSAWHHIIGRRNAATDAGLDIWIDGAAADFDTVTTDSGWGTNGFNLGVQYTGGGTDFFWNGLIDECAVWRRALSDAEIAQLYAGGAGLAYPF